VVTVGGDHFAFRFVDPVLVLLYFATAMAVVSAATMMERRSGLRIAAGAVFVAAGGFSSLFPFQGLEAHPRAGEGATYGAIASVAEERQYFERWARIGRWLKENASASESIAVRPAGAIPYFSDLRALDMLGINDREIARLPPRPGENVGHERQ